ncbi:MAG TPA: NUDIX domain-containing protein [Micromonospora sp.]|jgi:8-oxo-dGTP pyrophosphatase MutT (NUDIX family)
MTDAVFTSPPSGADGWIARRAARVLLVDQSNRVLLFHGIDPARPHHAYWFTPGGGLDPGETWADGAARELAEETGLRLSPTELGEPVWSETTEFPFDGRWYRQDQKFFLVRVPSWEVDVSGFGRIERDTIDGYRWWTIDELDTTDERFYPTELPTLLRHMLEGT